MFRSGAAYSMSARMRRLIAFLAAIAFALPAAAATDGEWRDDIDQVVRDIRSTHPDPFTKTTEAAFQKSVSALKRDLKLLSEEERTVRLMRIAASIGDGHTSIEPNNPAFAWWYPIRLYEFADGYFVTSAHKSVADLAGAQILRVAGKPVAEVAANARALMGADNASGARERLHALSNAALMKGLGYAASDGSLNVEVRLATGQIVERTLTARKTDFTSRYEVDDATFDWQFRGEMFGLPFGDDDEWISPFKNLPSSAFRTADASRPPHFVLRRPFVAVPLPKRDAYYAQINGVGSTTNNETFLAFFKRVMKEVAAQRPRRLILDWRYNFGGDGSQVVAMIHEFIKREDDRPWKELYVLTGRKTFSAAIMAVHAFTEHTDVTIVGEPSGAGPISFGDARTFTYKNIGVRMIVSTKWHRIDEYMPGDFIYVDAPAEFAAADYIAGRDPAVDPILDGKEMRSIPLIALASSGAAARRALNDRRAAFARYDWWKPTPFADLKRVGYQLLEDRKQPADAAEIFAALAELYPDEWNSWESLALALIASGRKDEGLSAMTCALAIDANIYVDDDTKKALAEAGKIAPPPGCPKA